MNQTTKESASIKENSATPNLLKRKIRPATKHRTVGAVVNRILGAVAVDNLLN
jgi:hypothetical protein